MLGAVTNPGPPWYAINVIDFPSLDRFTASSDLELKLVTTRLVGIGRVPRSLPSVVRLSKKIGEVTPKLPSGLSLFQTLWLSERFGYSPFSTALAHFTVTIVVPPAISGRVTVPGTHPGGNVCPIVTVPAVPA